MDFREAGRRVAEQLWGAERFEKVARAGKENATDGFLDMGLLAWSFFAREGLDFRTRLLVMIAVEAANGWTGTLRTHIFAALNVGVTPTEIKEVLTQITPYVGMPPINEAFRVANECFAKHRAPENAPVEIR